MEFIEDREEFIQRYNSKKLYNFTKLSDEIVEEFAPYLDLITLFLNGSISYDVCEKFKELIELHLPMSSLKTFQRTKEIVSELEHPTVPILHYTPNTDIISAISLNVTLPNKSIQIQVYPRQYITFNRKIDSINLSEHSSRREILGSINKGLLGF